MHPTGPGEGFVSGNGRIEATEIDVATKLGGRVDSILVKEGDFVKAGQVVAKMQFQVLDAQRGLFNAELALSAAQREYLVSAVTLYKALGGSWK